MAPTTNVITESHTTSIHIQNISLIYNESYSSTETIPSLNSSVTSPYITENGTFNVSDVTNISYYFTTSRSPNVTDNVTLRMVDDVIHKGLKRYPESLKTYAHIVDPLLVAIVTLAIFGILSNACVLLISRFASAGRFSTLVYMRSLCCADMMTGFYGVLKYSFMTRQPYWINCFLPEALVMCALLAEMFVLVGLFADCCVHLLSHTGRSCHVDKYSTIFGMVLIWNGAFALAFLPLMGWNNVSSSCEFFVFQSTEYISFTAFLFFMTLLIMLILLIAALIGISLLRRRTNLTMTTEVQIDRVASTLHTAVMDSCLHVLAFLPLVLYMLLHCSTCMYARAEYADAYLLVPLVAVQVKPFLAAIMRCVRTAEIARVISRLNLEIKTWLQSRSSQSVDLTASIRTNPDHVFAVSDHVDSNPQPEVSLGNLRSGLISASSLATAAAAAVKLPEVPTVACERCGHVNGSGSVREPRGSAGQVWHPLQLVYGGRQWQHMRLRRTSLWSSSSGLASPTINGPTLRATSRQTQSDKKPATKLNIPAKPRSHSISAGTNMSKQVTFEVMKRSNSASVISDNESSSSHGEALSSGCFRNPSNTSDVTQKENGVTVADITLTVPIKKDDVKNNGEKINPAFEPDGNNDVT